MFIDFGLYLLYVWFNLVFVLFYVYRNFMVLKCLKQDDCKFIDVNCNMIFLLERYFVFGQSEGIQFVKGYYIIIIFI